MLITDRSSGLEYLKLASDSVIRHGPLDNSPNELNFIISELIPHTLTSSESNSFIYLPTPASLEDRSGDSKQSERNCTNQEQERESGWMVTLNATNEAQTEGPWDGV